VDEADQAQIIIEKEKDRMIANTRRKLSASNATGCCVDCDVEISPERLKAVPGCDRCIKCQVLAEGGL
tara:strand:+ start:13924 stop:14127 length:204 start_codon:yes stop_codon:yes gene_type:complete